MGIVIMNIFPFSRYLKKDEKLSCFFFFHYSKRMMNAIAGVQLVLVTVIFLSFLVNLFLRVINLFLSFMAFLMLIIGVILFPVFFFKLRLSREAFYIKQVSFFILREFTMILETTGSLIDAIIMVIKGRYPYYSELFRKSLYLSHFESNLTSILVRELNKLPFLETNAYFFRLLENWSSTTTFLSQFKFEIENALQVELYGWNKSIDTYFSYYLALAAICPPIISILLILNDALLHFFWLIFLIYIFVLLLGSPFSIFYEMAGSWNVPLDEKRQSPIRMSNFLSRLRDLLMEGLPYDRAVVQSITSNEKSALQTVSKVKLFFDLGMDIYHKDIRKHIIGLIGEKVFTLVRMCRKFFSYSRHESLKVLSELISGFRMMEALIEETFEMIKAERKRLYITLGISLIVMGMLTNILGMFKLVSLLSSGKGIITLERMIRRTDITYSEILRTNEIFKEKVIIAIYSFILCMFPALFSPPELSKSMVITSSIGKFDRSVIKEKLKDYFFIFFLRLKRSLSWYALYMVSMLLFSKILVF